MAENENVLEKDRNKKYNDYVKYVTPTHSCPVNCIKAFITGGIICCIGQFIMNTLSSRENGSFYDTKTKTNS